MSYIAGVLETILPVFIVLAIGRLCRIRGLISRGGIDSLKSVAVDIALPAVLLKAFATASYGADMLIIPLMMFVLCILAWSIGMLLRSIFKGGSAFLPYICSGFEAGMLGYMFFTMLYGDKRLSSFALIDLGQVLFVFTLYKAMLGYEFSKQASLKKLLRSMLLSPVIISIALGIVLGATGLYSKMQGNAAGAVFDACVAFISAPTSVLILLSIGYDLEFAGLDWKQLMLAVLSRAAVMLALFIPLRLVIISLFPENAMLLKALGLMFILPPPFVLPVFAKDEAQSAYLSSVLSVMTAISIAAFAVLAGM